MGNMDIATPDTVSPRRGAAVLLEVLRSEGVRYIFGNPGTTELPLMDALTDAPDIAYIWGLQEAAVVAMAAPRRTTQGSVKRDCMPETQGQQFMQQPTVPTLAAEGLLKQLPIRSHPAQIRSSQPGRARSGN